MPRQISKIFGKIFVTCVKVDLMVKSFPQSFIFLSRHTKGEHLFWIGNLLLKDIVEFDNVVAFNNTGC